MKNDEVLSTLMKSETIVCSWKCENYDKFELKLLDTKNENSALYELKSSIIYVEHYNEFSLIICEPFSRILEIL